MRCRRFYSREDICKSEGGRKYEIWDSPRMVAFAGSLYAQPRIWTFAVSQHAGRAAGGKRVY
ncbi:hypothetical protein D7V90_06055 [bacterium 1xD42-87]|nr:hypothetical protein D7V90_06055 [bacterium 1xD42-87]